MSNRRTLKVREEAGDAPRILLAREIMATLAFVPTLLHFGWREPVLNQGLLHVLQIVAVAVFVIPMVISMRRSGGREAQRRFLISHSAEVGLVVIAVGLSWSWFGLALATAALMIVTSLRVYLVVVSNKKLPPGFIFVGSFLALIVVGTAGLMLPASTPEDQPINLLDASFTITSAISQTGLTVRPTGEGFTRFGQVIILIWIQFGALGILVFGAVVATLLGSSFGVRATQTLGEPTELGWAGQYSLGRLVVFIVVITHGLELLGAVAMYFSWPETWLGAPDIASTGDRIYHCVFFAVSSFCNAGFSTTANSYEGLRTHWTVHTILPALILCGSIGFPVLDNMARVAWARIRGRWAQGRHLIRLNVNTKVILTTTACLYLFGYGTILLSETVLEGVPISVAALDAHVMTFQRTTGFNTVSPNDMGLLAQLSLIFLMFIGGSPGSVAGGVKVMVFAVLAMTVWSTLHGRGETEVWGRRIPDEIVRKCATILALCLGIAMISAGVLAVTEHAVQGGQMGPILFEAVSAFGTTGLSMGITSELSPAGRITIMVTMFIGRVGALAIFAALFSVRPALRAQYSYPTGDVVIY